MKINQTNTGQASRMVAKTSIYQMSGLYTRLLAVLLLCVALFVRPLHAEAQQKTHQFDIAAMPLAEALVQFSKVTDIAILAPATILQNKQSRSMYGRYVAADALKLLLEGSQIRFGFKDDKTIILSVGTVREKSEEADYPRISLNSSTDYAKNLGYYDAAANDSRIDAANIDEIFITGSSGEYDKTKMSMSTQLLLDTPGTLDDPLWGFLTSPGVTFGSSAYSGEVIIRGSSPDDHLFLIDGMYAGYLFHDFGDGILSKNTIHRFQLKPSAFGAEYGGAIGSVVDVGLRNPDTSRFRGNIDINMIKAGVHLETPIGDRGGFYMDARYHTLHLFAETFDDEEDLNAQIDLVPENFDYTSRYRYENDGFAITFTVLGAQDIDADKPNPLVSSDILLQEETRSKFHTQAIAFEKRWDSGATLDTVFSHTKFDRRRTYGVSRFEDFSQDGYYVRSKFETVLSNHTIKAGVNFAREKGVFEYDTRLIFCDDFNGSCPSSDFEQRTRNDTFHDLELYAQDHIALTDELSMELGLQFSRDFFLKESFIEPRAGVFWQASENVKLYARAGRHHQRQDVRRSLTLRFTARAQQNDRSSHFLVGTQVKLARGIYLASEAYYKHQDAVLYATSSQERSVSGEVYGFEFTLSKPPKGKGFSGSASIGYANSKRRDEGNGQQINYRYNRPFNGMFGLKYTFGGGWSIGSRYHMQSGLLYTPLTGVTRNDDGSFAVEFGPLYSARTGGHNRLDFRIEKRSNHSFGEIVYHIDVLNALGQKSPEEPNYLGVMSDGRGGYVAPIHIDDGLPLIVSLGIGFTF